MSHLIHRHGRILYVSTAGNNKSAEVGNAEKPYKDPWAARTAAIAGDLIHVRSGIYIVSNLGGGGHITVANGAEAASKAVLTKEGVRMYFEPDCYINITASTGAALWGDFITPVENFEVYGHLSFDLTYEGQWPSDELTDGRLVFEFDNIYHKQGNTSVLHFKQLTNMDIAVKVKRHVIEDSDWTDNMRLVDIDGAGTDNCRISIEVEQVTCELGQVHWYTQFEGSFTDSIINIKIKNADIVNKTNGALFQFAVVSTFTNNIFNVQIDNARMRDPQILKGTYVTYSLNDSTISEDNKNSLLASEVPALVGLGNSWGGSGALIQNNNININVGNADLSGVLLGRMFLGPDTGDSAKNNNISVVVGNVLSRNNAPCFLPIANNGTSFLNENEFKCYIKLIGRATSTDAQCIWTSAQGSERVYHFTGGELVSKGSGSSVVHISSIDVHELRLRNVTLINDGVGAAITAANPNQPVYVKNVETNSAVVNANVDTYGDTILINTNLE